MSISFPEANQMVNVADLAQLNDALRKSANMGYQTPAGTAGATTAHSALSSLSPSRTPWRAPLTP